MPHLFDFLDAALFLSLVLFAAATLPLLINRALH